ncbi:MAG: cytochrome c [Gemmatimonadaceae bacterium]|nr:cytochrome c [Gemmatimonadaceae bacterium]
MRFLVRTLLGTLVLGTVVHAQAPDGKALYDLHCKKCHGPTGQPSAAMKKLLPELPLWDSTFFAARSDDDIVKVLTVGKGKNMKPFASLLTPEEMKALAQYIRTLKPSSS